MERPRARSTREWTGSPDVRPRIGPSEAFDERGKFSLEAGPARFVGVRRCHGKAIATFGPKKRDPDAVVRHGRHVRLGPVRQMYFDGVVPRCSREMPAKAEPPRPFARDLESFVAAKARGETVGGHEHARRHRSLVRVEVHGVVGAAMRSQRAPEAQIDADLAGSFGHRASERDATNRDRFSRELPLGERAIGVDVPNAAKSAVLADGQPFEHAQPFERAHARWHDPLAARLVGRLVAPLEHGDREPAARCIDGHCEPRRTRADHGHVELFATHRRASE
jgi:hypothetical protein